MTPETALLPEEVATLALDTRCCQCGHLSLLHESVDHTCRVWVGVGLGAGYAGCECPGFDGHPVAAFVLLMRIIARYTGERLVRRYAWSAP